MTSLNSRWMWLVLAVLGSGWLVLWAVRIGLCAMALRTFRSDLELGRKEGLSEEDASIVALLNTPRIPRMYKRWCVRDVRSGGYSTQDVAAEVEDWVIGVLRDLYRNVLKTVALAAVASADKLVDEFATLRRGLRFRGPLVRVPARMFPMYRTYRKEGESLQDSLALAIGTLTMISGAIRQRAVMDVYRSSWVGKDTDVVLGVTEHVVKLSARTEWPVTVEAVQSGHVREKWSYREHLRQQYASQVAREGGKVEEES